MKKKIENFMGILLLLIVFAVTVYYNFDSGYGCASGSRASGTDRERAEKIDGTDEEGGKKNDYIKILGEKKVTIVIDPGHGGIDPGKVGINDELEKNLNLAISLKLQEKLKELKINVVMTRSDDSQLSDNSDKGWKKTDMQNRVKIINESDADLCISIHQNSYPSSNVKGAQVFYYSDSGNGKKLAALIQNSLKTTLDDGNHRVEKSNDSYYILMKSECPTVIVECGFLSNWEEATNLKDDYYQGKIADAIVEGIIRYIKEGYINEELQK